MKRKKQWFAVILAALLAVGQGIVSAAPAERTEEAVTAEADGSASQEKTEAQTGKNQGLHRQRPVRKSRKQQKSKG